MSVQLERLCQKLNCTPRHAPQKSIGRPAGSGIDGRVEVGGASASRAVSPVVRQTRRGHLQLMDGRVGASGLSIAHEQGLP